MFSARLRGLDTLSQQDATTTETRQGARPAPLFASSRQPAAQTRSNLAAFGARCGLRTSWKESLKTYSNTLLVQKLMPSHPSPCKSLVSLSFSDPHDCVWAIDFHTNVTVKAPRLFETIDRAKFCEVPRSKLSLIDGFTSAILTTGLLCQVPMENYFNQHPLRPSQTKV